MAADLGPAIVTLIGTLGGTGIGAIGSYVVTRSTNRHAERIAEATQARQSEMELARAVRSARTRCYPRIVAAVQLANAHLTEDLERLRTGDSTEPTWTIESPEFTAAWSEIAVFASLRSFQASNAWSRAAGDFSRRARRAREALREGGQIDAHPGSHLLRDVDQSLRAMLNASDNLIDSMRADLAGETAPEITSLTLPGALPAERRWRRRPRREAHPGIADRADGDEPRAPSN